MPRVWVWSSCWDSIGKTDGPMSDRVLLQSSTLLGDFVRPSTMVAEAPYEVGDIVRSAVDGSERTSLTIAALCRSGSHAARSARGAVPVLQPCRHHRCPHKSHDVNSESVLTDRISHDRIESQLCSRASASSYS